MESDNEPDNEPACKKHKQILSRPGKPTPTIDALRKLSANITRRRFFDQCCKRESVLWFTPENSTSEHLVRALFDKAVVDPLNLIFAQNPGATRGAKDNVM